MRVPNSHHYQGNWRVQDLAQDFRVEDVWEFPLTIAPDQNPSLALFRQKAFIPVLGKIQGYGIAGLLFKTRVWMGELMGWDDSPNTEAIPGCRENSIKNRLTTQDEQMHQLTIDEQSLKEDLSPFQNVYAFDNESLMELSNRTVHALLHFAWIPQGDLKCKVQLAIYVKPRGRLGAIYMKLINPFRNGLIYPTLGKMIDTEWRQSLNLSST